MDDAERDRLRKLLDATHTFPGPYFLSVITVGRDEVFAALREAIDTDRREPVADDAWERVTSASARYTSHRLTVVCDSADEVLALYARVREVPGVVRIL